MNAPPCLMRGKARYAIYPFSGSYFLARNWNLMKSWKLVTSRVFEAKIAIAVTAILLLLIPPSFAATQESSIRVEIATYTPGLRYSQLVLRITNSGQPRRFDIRGSVGVGSRESVPFRVQGSFGPVETLGFQYLYDPGPNAPPFSDVHVEVVSVTDLGLARTRSSANLTRSRYVTPDGFESLPYTEFTVRARSTRPTSRVFVSVLTDKNGAQAAIAVPIRAGKRIGIYRLSTDWSGVKRTSLREFEIVEPVRTEIL
jgi:hypothetical protein